MQQYKKNLGKVSLTSEGVWNVKNSYEVLSIVYDEHTEHGFISKKDVPAGVDLYNKEYWMPFNVSGYADNNIIILSNKISDGNIQSYTLEEAIASIKSVGRRPGTILGFYNENVDRLDIGGRWELWQFNDTNIYNWDNVDSWQNLYYNYNKFMGWFKDENFLTKYAPFPEIGCYAFVGSEFNEATVYRCDNKYVWNNTTQHAWDYVKVIVDGNVTIGENGNWFNNGEDTGIPASIKGENGKTPVFREKDNAIQYSFDNINWITIIDRVAAWFRWNATIGDTQANNVGRIQISRDNVTWTNLSGDIINNLHISRYIGADETLPTGGIAEGTIYAKGPTYADEDTSHANPIYRLWVYAWKGDTLAWQDNGEFTSIAAGVVQEMGDSETEVMSQKAVSEKLSELELKQQDMIPVVTLKGAGTEPVVRYIKGLKKGHVYKVHVKEKGAIPSNIGLSDFNFVINAVDDNLNYVHDFVRTVGTEDVNDLYEFNMTDYTAIRIGARCERNTKLVVYIEDVTFTNILKNNISDCFSILNISQFKPETKLTYPDVETRTKGFVLTPFISCDIFGDIEFFGGVADESSRLCGYDKDFNYVQGYSQLENPRVVTFEKSVKFLRWSVDINNIGSYIKSNGTTIFEWTKTLKDNYEQFVKVFDYASSPLLKKYIMCSGRTVINPTTIDDILPNHTYRIYLKDTNPPSEGYSDVGMYKFSVRSYAKDAGEDEYTTLLNVVGADKWKPYYDIVTPSNASSLYLRARCEPNYKFEFYIEDITAKNNSNVSGILDANPVDEFLPKFQSAKKRYYTPNDTSNPTPYTIAHISDIHGNWTNVKRFIEFCGYWDEYIDLLVNSGDTVASNFSNGLDGYTSINDVQKIINVIGNHDTQDQYGNSWQTHIGLDIYNVLIKPFVENWAVVQPEGANDKGYCYFYKDIPANNLRIIFVDIMAYENEEDAWVKSVLSNANQIGYHVLIITHYAGATDNGEKNVFNKINCSYTTLYDFGTNSYGLNVYNRQAYKLMPTVQEFIDNGGNFCGYLQGHYHADFIAKIDAYPSQMIYAIGSTKEGEMRDYNHIIGTRNQDEFQIVSIDTFQNIVKLYKVGANIDLYGRRKDSVCINYKTGNLVC